MIQRWKWNKDGSLTTEPDGEWVKWEDVCGEPFNITYPNNKDKEFMKGFSAGVREMLKALYKVFPERHHMPGSQ